MNLTHIVLDTIMVALFGQTLAMDDIATNTSALDRRHIKMVHPNQAGFENQEWGELNPLAPDGSNYPCRPRKGLQLKVKGDPSTFTVGVKFKVKFEGEDARGPAVHGGGSCQFSLSRGYAPKKDTRFYVIKSIEGGCPKRHSDGELKPGQKPDTYEVEIPPEVQPGEWVFAWSWINRIGGQPEFYMNCAPIRVVAGPETPKMRRRRVEHAPSKTAEKEGPKENESKEKDAKQKPTDEKKRTGIDRLPAIFLANLGGVSGGCTTREALTARKAILYPHPGDIVERGNAQENDPTRDEKNLFKQACDGNPHNRNR